MNNLDKQYQELLKTILDYGVTKSDRTGTGTKSIFGYTVRHNMSEGFPLLTTKKMAIKSIMTELKWFLKGDTNIKYLLDNNCHIWDGDAYKKYEKYAMSNSYGVDILSKREFIEEIKTDDEFAKKWVELGPIYGKQWRDWNGIDQIQNLIDELKTNPDSRRLMVNAWNASDLNNMVLPPCHYGFQVYTRKLSFDERWSLYSDKPFDGNALGAVHTMDYLDDDNYPDRAISLMWNQRSVDTFLGLPFNIASYATLLMLIADEVNMVPDQLIGNLGDTHLYLNHIEQAKEQMGREPMELPKLDITNCDIKNGEFDYEIINYQSHPTIKAPLSN